MSTLSRTNPGCKAFLNSRRYAANGVRMLWIHGWYRTIDPEHTAYNEETHQLKEQANLGPLSWAPLRNLL
jgi:hypothetical protein